MNADKLQRLIASQMAFYKYSAEYMAACLRISKSAWYRRMREPETISFADLCKITKILHIDLFNLELLEK